MASRRPAASRAIARRVAALTRLQAQLRIELREVQPRVWRRILVPEHITLAKLHVVLNGAMGWHGGHLHEYEIARQRYGIPDPDWPDGGITDERRINLQHMLADGLRRFRYIYDLGDYWEHDITVEDLVVPTASAAAVHCLAGENACPPEDVGSAAGYAEFLAALTDTAHEDHDTMLQWIGGSFDPAAFDLNAINTRLASFKL